MRQTSRTARARRCGSVGGPGKALLSSDDDHSCSTRHSSIARIPPWRDRCRRRSIGARADVLAAARDLLAIPETALAGSWAWSERRRGRGPLRRLPGRRGARAGGDRGALADVRVERGRTAGGADHRAGDGRSLGPAWPAGAARRTRCWTPTRAATNGRSASTMGHIIAGQRGYAWGTAWWLEQAYDPANPDIPRRIDESLWETLPDEATTEAAGQRRRPARAAGRDPRHERRADGGAARRPARPRQRAGAASTSRSGSGSGAGRPTSASTRSRSRRRTR